MTWVRHNWSWCLELVLDHLILTVPSVLLAVVVAVPLGHLAYRRPVLGGPLLGVATLLYAIPALPLLIIVPVVFGLPLRSQANVIVALTLYGVALLVRTAADAFTAVDSRTKEAAVAIGYSPQAVLWQVELPLAVPVLLSGVRVVAVSTVGLVTIGALIGVDSLGTLITDGFDRSIAAEVATGVVATVVLALIVDAALLLLGRLLAPWAHVQHAEAREAQS